MRLVQTQTTIGTSMTRDNMMAQLGTNVWTATDQGRPTFSLCHGGGRL